MGSRQESTDKRKARKNCDCQGVRNCTCPDAIIPFSLRHEIRLRSPNACIR
jgi:hypothetical protein